MLATYILEDGGIFVCQKMMSNVFDASVVYNMDVLEYFAIKIDIVQKSL